MRWSFFSLSQGTKPANRLTPARSYNSNLIGTQTAPAPHLPLCSGRTGFPVPSSNQGGQPCCARSRAPQIAGFAGIPQRERFRRCEAILPPIAGEVCASRRDRTYVSRPETELAHSSTFWRLAFWRLAIAEVREFRLLNQQAPRRPQRDCELWHQNAGDCDKKIEKRGSS